MKKSIEVKRIQRIQFKLLDLASEQIKIMEEVNHYNIFRLIWDSFFVHKFDNAAKLADKYHKEVSRLEGDLRLLQMQGKYYQE